MKCNIDVRGFYSGIEGALNNEQKLLVYFNPRKEIVIAEVTPWEIQGEGYTCEQALRSLSGEIGESTTRSYVIPSLCFRISPIDRLLKQGKNLEGEKTKLERGRKITKEEFITLVGRETYESINLEINKAINRELASIPSDFPGKNGKNIDPELERELMEEVESMGVSIINLQLDNFHSKGFSFEQAYKGLKKIIVP